MDLISIKKKNKLATTYSHVTFRHTTIGAAMFHFRVRDGNGWFHYAMVTRIHDLRGVISYNGNEN